jgi:hypothetical protein
MVDNNNYHEYFHSAYNFIAYYYCVLFVFVVNFCNINHMVLHSMYVISADGLFVSCS